MSTIFLRQAPARWALALRRINAVTGAAAALLLAAALVWWLLIPGAQTQVMQHRLAVEQARYALKKAPMVVSAELEDVPESQRHWAAFMERLGDARYTEQQLKTLFAIASRVGLEMNQGEYKLLCEQAADTCLYQIQLPVHGAYPAIRRFSALALQAIPFASMDEMSLRRESASDDTLEARLKFTLYLHGRADLLQASLPDQP